MQVSKEFSVSDSVTQGCTFAWKPYQVSERYRLNVHVPTPHMHLLKLQPPK